MTNSPWMIFICSCFAVVPTLADDRIVITEVELDNRPHFRVKTLTATWWFDRAGGGFSRLIDREGRDWIGFKPELNSSVPESAAASYRGMPNLLHGRDNPDSGAGHPGFERCESAVVGRDMIRSVTKSGRWAWRWRFAATHAEFVIEKTDPNHPYWFLYEGPVAGRFAPAQQYWGTDQLGRRGDAPSHMSREGRSGRWQWAYFGDEEVHRVLFVAQADRDEAVDYFSYMGADQRGAEADDGMVVFGFGRSNRPEMRGAGRRFIAGLHEAAVKNDADHAALGEKIVRMLVTIQP